MLSSEEMTKIFNYSPRRSAALTLFDNAADAHIAAQCGEAARPRPGPGALMIARGVAPTRPIAIVTPRSGVPAPRVCARARERKRWAFATAGGNSGRVSPNYRVAGRRPAPA